MLHPFQPAPKTQRSRRPEFSRTLVALAILLFAGFAQAADWKDLASGEHSFKTLGPNFFVDVPVRAIPDAEVRLVFVNRVLIKQLGLGLPADSAELETFLKGLFAFEVDPTGQSPKKWFATHYLDATDKSPGSALGDGRALWTGELKLTAPDGKIVYIDAVQKGVGVTPYAWFKNKSHNDGKQNGNELVYSGILSMAAQANQLDSTGDILGFAIKRNGRWTTQTLRVGRQTRPAHIAYHADAPADEVRMMDYIIRRDLGLEMTTPVTEILFAKWETQFARNSAEEAARFYDLLMIQESPTKGNKTTAGGSIDLGGVRYFDAYHVKFKHLFGRLEVGEQVRMQRSYNSWINGWLESAKYPFWKPELTAKMNEVFDAHFQKISVRLALARLGLSDRDIQSLEGRPDGVAERFFKAQRALKEAVHTGSSVVMYPGNETGVESAAFDIRKIMCGTMKLLTEKNPARQVTLKDELFRVDRAWGQALTPAHVELANAYLQAASTVVQSFHGVKPEWLARAQALSATVRGDQNKAEFWQNYENRGVQMIEADRGWLEITRLMEQGAASLTDEGLSPRAASTLKVPGVRSGPGACRAVFSPGAR